MEIIGLENVMCSSFWTAQLTDRGGRRINEDNLLSAFANGITCWVVADGLGGHGGGANASAIGCQAAIESFLAAPTLSREAVYRYICAANDAVLLQQKIQPELRRMRTTMVVLLTNMTHAAWGHVGDSRLYHLRTGKIIEQTKDHSVPQSLADAGVIGSAAIRHHEDRGRLLRALGEDTEVELGISPRVVPLLQHDAFLLCSDGFWENVYEAEMELDYADSNQPEDWLLRMERRLQERVTGSHDNYTAIVAMERDLPQKPFIKSSQISAPPIRNEKEE
jgi:serine/threonine protein phosphatase PrpC